MIFQKTLALFALTYADAFTFTSTSRGSIAVPKTNPQSFTTNAYTKLYAEESEESEEAAESPEETAKEEALDEAPPSGENDILNSPAFLKRKLDVLKSDIESVEGRISEANDVYEANKAEWGPQIDKLREEVCTNLDVELSVSARINIWKNIIMTNFKFIRYIFEFS